MSIHNKISVAKIEDTDAIMKFIDNEWKQGHILGNNKDYFLYEYKNNDHLNFVISKNQANKINGILGFIKSSSDDNATVWTTMWKISKSTAIVSSASPLARARSSRQTQPGCRRIPPAPSSKRCQSHTKPNLLSTIYSGRSTMIDSLWAS